MVTLSPKFGFNPTIAVCLFCGEDKNCIALMGRVRSKKYARDDIEMPMRSVIDLEPCDSCKKKFEDMGGVACVEVRGSRRHHKPTGRFVVVNESVFEGSGVNAHKGQVLKIEEEAFCSMFSEILKGE